MIRMTLAALLLASVSVAAFADSDASKVTLQPGWLTSEQIAQRLQSQGYTVRKIKLDDGDYEVKATGPGMQKTKLKISPSSGAVLSSKTDDDD